MKYLPQNPWPQIAFTVSASVLAFVEYTIEQCPIIACYVSTKKW